ncbi:unnamed protein product [Linum tenue]|uniref:Uncharacterized protein n=2 Tax=Linum tenue TaxID=586396 RepID=A0AAV0H550_9ROSI|nr:unnamed protein product [Linum tenue]
MNMVAKRAISGASRCRRNRIRTSDEGEPSLPSLRKNMSTIQDRENEENILKPRSGISRAFTESDFVINKM